MRSLDVSPIVLRALDVAERHLGAAELARQLNAPWNAVKLWRTGHLEMPEYMFLRLVDILTELDPSWNEQRTK
jgi:hypothetical protein